MTDERLQEIRLFGRYDFADMEAREIEWMFEEVIAEIDRLREVARIAAEYIADESAGSMEFWRAYEPGEH